MGTTRRALSGIINRYREYLPVSNNTPLVTLNEGNTPLIHAANLSRLVGRDVRVFLKYEGLNPTASFKDRGMTMAISKAKEEKYEAVMCASTGNTSASAAAYAARAKMKCIVLIPKGAIAMGKLAQALIHGARVLAINGNFDDALLIARDITAKYPIKLVNSINPFRLEGQKTAAFEVCDALGHAPDFLSIPVGNAGNITAYWRGFKEYRENKKITKLPRMLGFQAAGAAPIVKNRVVKNPHTVATAIKIGNPANWQSALIAQEESRGLIAAVTDKEILNAYKLLAAQEGVFVEPASAASVAGILNLSKKRFFRRRATIVCVLTGHGLKDPDRVIKSVKPPKILPPKVSAVLKEIGC